MNGRDPSSSPALLQVDMDLKSFHSFHAHQEACRPDLQQTVLGASLHYPAVA